MKRILTRFALVVAVTLPWKAFAAADKPNILMIMSDDVGITNLSAYSRGMAGYQTPNIDRIANGGVLFTDYYSEQSCTAGRSAFITGQSPIRTGLTKVGFPGASIGLQKEDPTLAEMLARISLTTLASLDKGLCSPPRLDQGIRPPSTVGAPARVDRSEVTVSGPIDWIILGGKQ